MTDRATVMSILDLARWAPSGDNTQPWRFEIVSGDHVVVHGFDTREHCVYDLDGRASQLALGALLETLRIAATGHALDVEVTRRLSYPEMRPTFDVRFVEDKLVKPSTLIPYIRVRSVQRRAFQTRWLTANEKSALKSSVGSQYRLLWFEGWSGRLAMARITSATAKVRLTIPEAYNVHRRVIEWGAQFSEDRIPEQALGLDPVAARLSRWIMKDWRRVEFFNRYLAGSFYPRLKLDFIPSLACAAHVAMLAEQDAGELGFDVYAGMALQRLWLTATQLGLQLQPEMVPLVFARYAYEGRTFTQTPGAQRQARRVAERIMKLAGPQWLAKTVWLARIGAGIPACSRSTRLPLQRLLVPK